MEQEKNGKRWILPVAAVLLVVAVVVLVLGRKPEVKLTRALYRSVSGEGQLLQQFTTKRGNASYYMKLDGAGSIAVPVAGKQKISFRAVIDETYFQFAVGQKENVVYIFRYTEDYSKNAAAALIGTDTIQNLQNSVYSLYGSPSEDYTEAPKQSVLSMLRTHFYLYRRISEKGLSEIPDETFWVDGAEKRCKGYAVVMDIEEFEAFYRELVADVSPNDPRLSGVDFSSAKEQFDTVGFCFYLVDGTLAGITIQGDGAVIASVEEQEDGNLTIHMNIEMPESSGSFEAQMQYLPKTSDYFLPGKQIDLLNPGSWY